jgi:Xaa-Pro aminopeptidase
MYYESIFSNGGLMLTSIKISSAEHRSRAEQLLHHILSFDLLGVILFDSNYILYYTGFAFIPTERPIAYIMNAQGEEGLFVPRLEVEHAKSLTNTNQIVHYTEYPYTSHPMNHLQKMLQEMKIDVPLGSDSDGYPWIFGYRGPTLTELTGKHPVRVSGFIEDQMAVKSPSEISLIQESVKWGNLAHTLLQRYTQVGETETAVSTRASNEANLAMLDAIGPIYKAQSYFSNGASAGYRGQIGRNSAIPHALANNIVFQPGDVLVTGANAPIWGYNSELERTMFIGKPTDEQKRLFNHMIALQEIAFKSIRPGTPCSQVDIAVREYYEQQRLMNFWKHHVGHAIGLRYHEGPFLDIGDETIIQPGMIFTVEPGLYHPELGGFRHSDTVAVTENGIEIMTYYPRDIESLTIPL